MEKAKGPRTYSTLYKTAWFSLDLLLIGIIVQAWVMGWLLYLWETKAVPSAYGVALFVARGLVWQGVQLVDPKGNPTRKSENARVVGLDLRTGEKEKQFSADKLVSPGHRHRCYRNKATEHYAIIIIRGRRVPRSGRQRPRAERFRTRDLSVRNAAV